MSITEYENDIFRIKIESEVGVHLLPPAHSDTHAQNLIKLINRLHLEADVITFKAVELTPTTFSVQVTHSNGTYRDEGELMGSDVHVTWPTPIDHSYQVKYLQRLFEIRQLLVQALLHFHPTLIDVEFL